MSEQFYPGDTVQLKTSGRKMTVARVRNLGGNIRVECEWTDKAFMKRDTYSPDVLKRVNVKPKQKK